jgi:hypothetical protein
MALYLLLEVLPRKNLTATGVFLWFLPPENTPVVFTVLLKITHTRGR